MSNLKIKQIAVISLLSFGLAACGGGGGGGKLGPKVYSGVFKDSAVRGLTYVSGEQKAVTGANGEFKFEEDSSITFSIGGVNLGTAKAKNVMTPMDLVPNGKADTPEVINRVRFLMMLDKNSDPEDNIEITKEVQKVAKEKWENINFSEDIFPSGKVNKMAADASAKDGESHYIPSKDSAKLHFNRTLSSITAAEQCVDSGTFVGEYTGSEKGSIALMIDPTTNGAVIGSIFHAGAPAEVASKTSINYENPKKEFISQTNDILFTGALNSGNVLKGTWVNKNDPSLKGEFEAKRLGGDSSAIYRYTAVFRGKDTTNRGVIAIDVYANNTLKGKFYDVTTNNTSDLNGRIKENELEDVTLTNEGKMKGDIIASSIEAYVVGKTELFTANRCKLSK